MRSVGRALAVVVALSVVGPISHASGAPGFSARLGRAVRTAHFRLSYSGSGSYRTVYHATPPNPGGNPDTDDADDSSTASWNVNYAGALAIPRCRVSRNRRSPCLRVTGPTMATGPTAATGQVDHTHADGLYTQLNSQSHCSVQYTPTPVGRLPAAVTVRYLPRTHAFALTVLDPVVTAFTLIPGQCPSQGDSLDGLYDNYFTPGFSFAPGYGPERWFTSRTLTIPARVLHRAVTITADLANTPRGASPPDCAVRNPSYERCSTGGSWTGVLTLNAIR